MTFINKKAPILGEELILLMVPPVLPTLADKLLAQKQKSLYAM